MENEAATAISPAASSQYWPRPVRIFGHIVSFIFHPLFIPSYLALFFLYADPYAFAAMDEKGKILKLISIVFSTAFLPMFSVALMKQLGFIESIMLRTQKDRIIPYIVSMIFYFWAWYVSKNLHDSPAVTAMLLAVFLSCIAGMMANIYYKISMHGIAVGTLFILFLWMAYSGTLAFGSWLAIATLVTGLVCTARLIVSDHTGFEVYSGVLAGALCQLVAIGIAA